MISDGERPNLIQPTESDNSPDLEPEVKGKGRGRPALPEAERFQQLTSEPFDLSSWPNRETPCWFTDRKVLKHRGRLTTPRRAAFECLVDEPLKRSWRLIQACSGWECINPHHMMIEAQYRIDAPFELLPEWLLVAQIGDEIAAQEPADDVEDCIFGIQSIDGGDEMPASHFVERWSGMYDLATCERALALIKERKFTE